MKNLLVLIFVLSATYAYAQIPTYFNYLKKIKVAQNEHIIFGYDASNTKIVNKFCADEKTHWGCFNGEDGSVVVATTNDDKLAILFNPGPSEDPLFTIVNRNKKELESISATELYITSANVIYTAGSANQMYNKRQKFTLSNDKIVEEKQPFYYVGLKSKTTKTITLYKTKTGKEIIATLPANYEVEVLLADSDPTSEDKYYLIKTDFGLMGWMRLAEPYTYDTGIENLKFMGD